MRTTLLATSFVLLCASSTFAQKAGDRIVVTAARVPLKSRNGIVGSFLKGQILTVKEVDGDWFWVIHSGANGTTKGWVKRPDVVALEKAIDFFNDELRRTPAADLLGAEGEVSTMLEA